MRFVLRVARKQENSGDGERAAKTAQNSGVPSPFSTMKARTTGGRVVLSRTEYLDFHLTSGLRCGRSGEGASCMYRHILRS